MRGRVGTAAAIALLLLDSLLLPSLRLSSTDSIFLSLHASTLTISLFCSSRFVPPSFNHFILSLSVLISPCSLCATFLSSLSRPVSSRSPLSLLCRITRLFYSNPVAPPVFYFSSIHVSPTNGFFLPVRAVSFYHFVSPLFPFRPFLSPMFVAFHPMPPSLSLSWDNPRLLSLFYFHFPRLQPLASSFFFFSSLPVEHIVPLPFLPFARFLPFPPLSLSLSLSLVFSFSFFLFRVAISRLCPARREPSPSLSRSLSRVCGTRETIMGRTGWLCPPQDIGCRGEIGNRVYALSVLLVSSVFLQSHPFSLPLHLLFYLCPAFYAIQCSSLSLQCVSLPLALHPARPREPWIRRGRVLYAPPDWRAATPHELFGNLIVS